MSFEIKPPDDWYDMMLDYFRWSAAERHKVGGWYGAKRVKGHLCFGEWAGKGQAVTTERCLGPGCDQRYSFYLKVEEVNAVNWLWRVWQGHLGPLAGFQRYLDGEVKGAKQTCVACGKARR